MIRLIHANNTLNCADDIEAMHRLRAAVFRDRLGWDVVVEDGRERDRFDDLHPLYLVSRDEAGEVRGTLRLLPTTGPNMLRDVFGCLLSEDLVVESPLVWESSRFSVDLKSGAERSANRLNRATGELLAGIVEVGLAVGLTHVVSVYDVRMARVLKTAGCPAEIIGTPQRIGGVLTYAGLFSVDEEMLARVRAAAGIVGPILEPSSDPFSFAA